MAYSPWMSLGLTEIVDLSRNERDEVRAAVAADLSRVLGREIAPTAATMFAAAAETVGETATLEEAVEAMSLHSASWGDGALAATVEAAARAIDCRA